MSEPLSAIHQGLPALRASPQAFWTFASVTGANPGTFETSGVTLYFVPGGAAGAAPANTKAATSPAASAAGAKRNMSPPPVAFLPLPLRLLRLHGLNTTVQEVAPGVSRLTFPMPVGVGHVHCYLLRGEDGWTLVDTAIAFPGAE